MIPIYLFNASPWGSLTKGYRLLNPLSLREMREKNPYRVQRMESFLSSCITHASWSPLNANVKKEQTCVHIFKGPMVFFLHLHQTMCLLKYIASLLQIVYLYHRELVLEKANLKKKCRTMQSLPWDFPHFLERTDEP